MTYFLRKRHTKKSEINPPLPDRSLEKNGNLIFYYEDKMRFENLNNLMRGQSREEEIDASSSN